MVNTNRIQAMPSQDADAWVSVLLDGELDDAEAKRALGRIREDAGAVARWRDYCQVSDAMHANIGDSDRFMARFRDAFEAEPTVLAPVPAKKTQAAPYLWTAAAAAMAAITWTVWTAMPPEAGVAPMAAADVRPAANDARPVGRQLEPYLAAHQDYAYAVVSMPDMVLEKVSLAGSNR